MTIVGSVAPDLRRVDRRLAARRERRIFDDYPIGIYLSPMGHKPLDRARMRKALESLDRKVDRDARLIIGGGAAIIQFTRVGAHSFVGGMSGLENDLIPYGMAIGNRAYLSGLNIVGLQLRYTFK